MKMYPYYNSMPTATQPYGYPMTNFGNYNQQATPQNQLLQQQNQQQQGNTNMIFVSSVDDVKSRWQPFSSSWIYIDNDKPLIYKKTLDNNGQYEIKTFDLVEHKEISPTTQVNDGSNNLSNYAKTSDIVAITSQINELKAQVEKLNNTPKVQSNQKYENAKPKTSQTD